MRQRVLQWVFGAGYVLLGALGLGMLLHPSLRSETDWYVGVFLGALLALVGVTGVVLLAFVALHDRLRLGPALGTAPSGAPATFFRRSPFMVVAGVLVPLALALWLGALAVVLYRHGHGGWASLVALCTLCVLWPVVVAGTGKVEVGGLWLTRTGLEYRREAVGWALPWSELHHVEPQPHDRTVVGALPHTGGRTVPVQPVVLALEPEARLDVRRTVRWAWDRECRVPDGRVCIDCVDLAGGPALITEAIAHYLAHPRLREQLGTDWSLPRRVH